LTLLSNIFQAQKRSHGIISTRRRIKLNIRPLTMNLRVFKRPRSFSIFSIREAEIENWTYLRLWHKTPAHSRGDKSEHISYIQ
jgi:nucleosome binding factor SPN SPT16 subunit